MKNVTVKDWIKDKGLELLSNMERKEEIIIGLVDTEPSRLVAVFPVGNLVKHGIR